MDQTDLTAVVNHLQKKGLKLVTAESCTAGLIASTLAEPAGSGKWLDCAYITYSEEAKIACLNVDEQIIERYGLTSEEVARAMSEGALGAAKANLSIATTGVAGPSSGDGQVPVGTVCLAWTFKTNDGIKSFSEKQHFDGDRNEVREKATAYALKRIEPYHRQLHCDVVSA